MQVIKTILSITGLVLSVKGLYEGFVNEDYETGFKNYAIGNGLLVIANLL